MLETDGTSTNYLQLVALSLISNNLGGGRRVNVWINTDNIY